MKARLSKVVSLVSVLVVFGMSFTHRVSAHVEPEGPPPGGGVTVVPPPRATTEEGAHEEEWEDQDHVRVGALLGLGFPRPFCLEALVKIERTHGLGAEVGFMPSLKGGPLEGSFWGVAGDLRVFPFQGAFFIGLRAGYQRLHARATAELPILGTLTETATAETYFVNPRVGFLWTLRSLCLCSSSLPWARFISPRVMVGILVAVHLSWLRSASLNITVISPIARLTWPAGSAVRQLASAW